MKKAKLGGLEVSAQGLGCMGMSEFRGHADWDESIATIHRALDLGVTFFDTADVYGAGHNEVLLGRAVHGKRDKVQIATKFGIDRSLGDLAWAVRGDRAYCRRAVETSLLRMGTDYIDLFYIHFPPKNCEIEETIDAMAELVKEGKVLAIGVSNSTAELVRRAYAVHPIAAMQSEYSIWTREAVEQVTPVMSELGVGLVPYGPLGRGFLTGSLDIEKLDANDLRKDNPRFTGEAAEKNLAIVDAIRAIAAEYGVPPGNIALAWVYEQQAKLGVTIVPIPGTKRIKWLEQNVNALSLKLSDEHIETLNTLADQAIGKSFEFKNVLAWRDGKQPAGTASKSA